jgi:hypothetical protein
MIGEYLGQKSEEKWPGSQKAEERQKGGAGDCDSVQRSAATRQIGAIDQR